MPNNHRANTKPPHARTILAGIAGGVAMNLTMPLTFRLLGFGWNGGDILIRSSFLEPVPLVVNMPAPIIIGIVMESQKATTQRFAPRDSEALERSQQRSSEFLQDRRL